MLLKKSSDPEITTLASFLACMPAMSVIPVPWRAGGAVRTDPGVAE